MSPLEQLPPPLPTPTQAVVPSLQAMPLTDGRVLAITETLSDSVVSVTELSAPSRTPNRRPLLLALAAFLSALSLFAFAKGVANSQANSAAQSQWVEVERLPIADFRPENLSVVYDVLAFGGLGGALACFVLLLARRRRSSDVLIAGQGGTIGWDGVAPFELVRVTESGATLQLPMQKAATLTAADGTKTSVAGVLSLEPDPRLSWSIDRGIGALHIRWTERARPAPLAGLLAIEGRTAKFIAASAVAHLAFLALLFQIPAEASAMSTDMMGTDSMLSRMVDDATEDAKKEEPEPSGEGEAGTSAEGEPVAIAKGNMGDPERPRDRETRAMIKKRGDSMQIADRGLTPETITRVGVLAAIGNQQIFQIGSANDFTDGIDDDDIYGNSMNGTFGVGGGPGGSWGNPNGSGIAPAGSDYGTINGDKIGVHGHDVDGFNRRFSGNGTRTGRKTKDPVVNLSCPAGQCVVSGHDKALIARYIRRQKRRVRNCYERSLLTSPSLSGSVMANFLITPQGSVKSASVRGIGNGKLEGCIAGVIRSIQFPPVPSGTMARVRYPFSFSPAGS